MRNGFQSCSDEPHWYHPMKPLINIPSQIIHRVYILSKIKAKSLHITFEIQRKE